jgi:hypothetical protein
MVISKDQAIEIIRKFIASNKGPILDASMELGEILYDEPPGHLNLYCPPKNCFFMSLNYSIEKYLICGPSVVIAIDKETGAIRFFGAGNDEG